MMQNEIMKALVRKVDEKGASNPWYAHCDQWMGKVCFIARQGHIRCTIRDGRKRIIDPTDS